MSTELLIACDVGNTNVVLGVYEGDRLVQRFRLSTDRDRTADDYSAALLSLFQRAELDPARATAMIVASVVPTMDAVIADLGRRTFGRDPLFVRPGVRTGLPIRYDNPADVGADRIVNAVAARELHGSPVVVVDFGTATTFDVVNEAGEYIGGIIAPGLGISAGALFARASRLAQVEIRRPETLVGSHTVGAMQSGLYYGYIGLVDGILARLKKEIPAIRGILATGGQAELIASGSEFIERVEPDLVLFGLKLVHDLNA